MAISEVVVVDPAVAVAQQVKEAASKLFKPAGARHRLVDKAGVNAPACLGDVDPVEEDVGGKEVPGVAEVLLAELQGVTKTYRHVRSLAVKRAYTKSDAHSVAKKEKHLLLRYCPDLLSMAVHILQEYHEKREVAGEVLPFSISH